LEGEEPVKKAQKVGGTAKIRKQPSYKSNGPGKVRMNL